MGGTCAPPRALGAEGVESGPVMSDFAGERNALCFLLSSPGDSTLIIVWFPYTIPGSSYFFLPSSPAGGDPHDQWCFSSSPDSSMGAVLRLRTNNDRTRPDESSLLTLDHSLSQWLVFAEVWKGGWFSVNCVRYVFRRRSRTSLSPHSRAVGLAR